MSHASLIVALDSTADIEQAVAFQMQPFCEDGAWFADGSRWDWYSIGGRFSGYTFAGQPDILRRGDLDIDKIAAARRDNWRNNYREAQGRDVQMRGLIYGIHGDESEADYMTRRDTETGPLSAFAFLRNRVWQEKGRMGWFGADVRTECEIAAPDADTHICIHEKDGAKIVSWSNSERFGPLFYKRFIEKLVADTVLVAVDYHV